MPHTSVLLEEVIKSLNIQEGKTYIDLTFGASGYTREILLQNNSCKVIAFDRDETVKKFADDIVSEFPDRFFFIHDRFSNFVHRLKEIEGKKNEESGVLNQSIGGIVADLGVSSMQLDDKARGFSFESDDEISMDMGLSSNSALKIVNRYNFHNLQRIIKEYGEDRLASPIAKKIIYTREKEGKITSTKTLADLVFAVYKRYGIKRGKIHPATKTFQAIRIEVNEELEEIKQMLQSIKENKEMFSSGFVSIVSFHSLEDSIVKNFFKDNSQKKKKNKYSEFSKQEEVTNSSFTFQEVKDWIKPSQEEIEKNIRARSATLRSALVG